MNPNYYSFATFTGKNLSALTGEWFDQLPGALKTDETRAAAGAMCETLEKHLIRDEGSAVSVGHGDFAQACLTLLGGASRNVLREGGAGATEGLLCAELFSFLAAKLYHRNSGRTAREIVAEAMKGCEAE